MRVIIECTESEKQEAIDLRSDFKQAHRDFGGWDEAAKTCLVLFLSTPITCFGLYLGGSLYDTET